METQMSILSGTQFEREWRKQLAENKKRYQEEEIKKVELMAVAAQAEQKNELR